MSSTSSNNKRPDSTGKGFLASWWWIILAGTLLLLPFIGFGAVKSMKVYANDIRQWLPKGFEEAELHDWFVEHFGVDEMMVVSWDECDVDNPEVYDYQKQLVQLELDGRRVFSKTMSGPQMLGDLMDLGLSERAAKKRIDGLLVGNDGKTTCILAFPAAGLQDRRTEIVGLVRGLAKEQLGLTADQLRIGGPTADGAAVDVESKKSLNQFLWMTVVAVFLLTWYRLRDLPLSLIVLVHSVLCAGASLAILYWSGGKMNLTMVMLPTLTFILGVSGCVHMANYYRKAAAFSAGINAASRALKDAYFPVVMSSVTTAIGMVSLATSKVVPIKQFGVYSAIGILCSIPVILLVMPSVLFMLKGTIRGRYSKQDLSRRELKSGVSRRTSRVVNWVCRSHWWVTVPSLIALVALAIGISQLKASVKIQNRFANKTQIIQDYHWLEENLGPLVPMEVVLRVPTTTELTEWEQMEIVYSVENALEQTTDVNATYSAATFRPPVPRRSGLRNKLQREVVIKKWTNEIAALEQARLLQRMETENLWRISVRVAALNDIDYGEFLDDIQQNVDRQIKHLGDQHPKHPQMDAVITGSIPLVYQAQHQILFDLMKSFLTAFIFITIILMLVLRSFRAGLIAMIPNIFPPVMVFGAMGWLGVNIEIGSVMTASVALGIAVDDTIHFLTWYRRGTKEGKSRYKSIQYAFDHCAKAMIDTSLICGLGVAPFLFSVFMPTVRFSRLLLILLMTALVGDLILLPAILAGPAGVLFRLKRRKKEKSTSQSAEIACLIPPIPSNLVSHRGASSSVGLVKVD